MNSFAEDSILLYCKVYCKRLLMWYLPVFFEISGKLKLRQKPLFGTLQLEFRHFCPYSSALRCVKLKFHILITSRLSFYHRPLESHPSFVEVHVTPVDPVPVVTTWEITSV